MADDDENLYAKGDDNLDRYNIDGNNLGGIVKRQRLMIPLTLRELADMSSVSLSYLGRIERGERFPSPRILRKIAKPLGFGKNELFMLADYLSPGAPTEAEGRETYYSIMGIDPYVATLLAQEPAETQRALIRILGIFKRLRESTTEE